MMAKHHIYGEGARRRLLAVNETNLIIAALIANGDNDDQIEELDLEKEQVQDSITTTITFTCRVVLLLLFACMFFAIAIVGLHNI